MKKLFSLLAIISLLSLQLIGVTYAEEPVFSDVTGHEYEYAIDHVQTRGIVSGYDDGTYRPDNLINRAEFTKILVEHLYNEGDFDAYTTDECFTDVPSGEWYTRYVCFAKDNNIISGHPDGSFKPSDNINYVESLKIVIEANVQKGTLNLGLTELGKYWYSLYVDFVDEKCEEAVGYEIHTGCLPLRGLVALDEKMTRAETAVIIAWMGLMTQ